MANNPNPNPNPNCSSTVARSYPMNSITQQQPSSSSTHHNKICNKELFVLCLIALCWICIFVLLGVTIYDDVESHKHITSRLNVNFVSLSYYNNNNLNLNHSSADLPLQTFYEISFNFTMHNQHRNPSIKYLDIQAQVLYFDDFLTDKESIPSFSLAKNESTLFSIKYLVQPKPHLNEQLLEIREVYGMLIFDVHVYWRTHSNEDGWKNYFAKCYDVMLDFDNDTSTTAFMLGGPKQCKIVRTSKYSGGPIFQSIFRAGHMEM
ncbi:hypothetical protein IHE45_14G064200 [Dioscorea alata]|uniref:Uncharacterized protein n=1 Tax=Dioscorea alata TaxID=55571 RepID=A0ACB7US85_DIOAL|nr:hypothetical protein IHE45_14G064200 [Dioscorea alata]